MKFDLVFEGGGAKGTVFGGALKEFARRGHTHGRLLGTSAGAITSTLLAAGYSVEEILTALAETKDGKSVFNDFLAPPNPIAEDVLDSGALATFLKEVDVPLVPEFVENRQKKHSFISWRKIYLPAISSRSSNSAGFSQQTSSSSGWKANWIVANSTVRNAISAR